MKTYVYVKPAGHCPNCEWVKAQFRNAGVSYVEEIINEDVLEYAKEKGFKSAPVVIAFPDAGGWIEFAGQDRDGVGAVIAAAKEE